MAAISKLEGFNKRLQDIFLITGYGLSSNIYVIGKNDLTLIDSGSGEINDIGSQLEVEGLKIESVKKVILTHHHYDHIGGLLELAKNKNLPKIFIHELELPMLKIDIDGILPLQKGIKIDVEDRLLEVIHTPGHTIGSICLYDKVDKILFSGDTVFPNGSFGRCDLETGDIIQMIKSLETLTQIDAEIMLPGHERPLFQKVNQHIHDSLFNAKYLF